MPCCLHRYMRPFDHTSIKTILEATDEWEIRPVIKDIINFMLSNRITCPRNKRTSGSNRAEHQYIKPTRGCPQGGVDSPIYWNMVINKLITILHGLGIHVVAYADDLALLISGISTMTLCSIMNT